MNVSKVNVLNVNKTGVSLFRGDTPVHSETDDKKSKIPSSTKFLYGAGIVSAGIIAAALAGRAGLFAKSVKKAGETVSQETSRVVDTFNDVLKDREIVKQIPAKYTTAELPIHPPRAERLKANAIDTEALKSNIDYSKYKKAKTPEKKNAFFEEIGSGIYKMTYEQQYEELEHFFKFIKKLEPEEVRIPFDIDKLKRDNNLRFVTDTIKFIDKNPKYKDVFKEVVSKRSLVVSNRIMELPYKEQFKEFSSFLKTLETLKPGEVDLLIDTARLKQDNAERIMREAVDFISKNPKHKSSFKYLLSSYLANINKQISELPYEEQFKKFNSFLETLVALKPGEVDVLINTAGLKQDNAERIMHTAVDFMSKNPEYKSSFNYMLTNYSVNISRQIGELPYEAQFDKFKSYLGFLKKLEPSQAQNHVSLAGLRHDNNERFIKETLKFVNANPDYRDAFKGIFKSYSLSIEKQIGDLSYNHEEQFNKFNSFLQFVKKLDPSEVRIPFDPSRLKGDNNVKCMRAAMKFVQENPQYKEAFQPVIVRYADNFINFNKLEAEFGKEMREAIFDGKQALPGIKAAFFTNSENAIAKMPYDKKVEGFKSYLEFIKTLDPKKIENHILFTPGKYDWDKNVEIAKEAVEFAKANPKFKDTIVSNLLSYEPDLDFAKKLTVQDVKFNRRGDIAAQYDKHVDNIITIRKLLTESGLKCNENARFKNRQDWLDSDMSPTMLGFQYSPRLPEIKHAAFEYDMMNGITRKEADEMIKRLSSDKSVVKKELNVIVDELAKDGIPKDNLENLLKNILKHKNSIRNRNYGAYDEISKLKRDDEKAYETAKQLIVEQAAKDINAIHKKIANTYEELKKLGVTQEKTDYILKQLTSQLTQTETERLYGMTLDDMIAKINAAVVKKSA